MLQHSQSLFAPHGEGENRKKAGARGMRGNIVIYHNPSMWFERTPEVLDKMRQSRRRRRKKAEPNVREETPTRVLGFWIQAMAGDRLTPVLSLILIKPKGGKRLRPAHLVYEKQPSAGVALAEQAVALFGHK